MSCHNVEIISLKMDRFVTKNTCNAELTSLFKVVNKYDFLNIVRSLSHGNHQTGKKISP